MIKLQDLNYRDLKLIFRNSCSIDFHEVNQQLENWIFQQ